MKPKVVPVLALESQGTLLSLAQGLARVELQVRSLKAAVVTAAVGAAAAVPRRACAMCSMPLLRLPFHDNGTSHLHCPTSDQLGRYCRCSPR